MKRKVFQLILICIIEGCLSSNAFRLESSFSDSIVKSINEDY